MIIGKLGIIHLMVVKQCCDSISEPSQQGNLEERKVGWKHVLMYAKYNDKDH